MTSQIAFVLPGGHSGEPVNFPGFPGVWTPGEAKLAAELVAAGAFESVDQVVARVEELGLPLEQVTVEVVAPLTAAERRAAQRAAREAAATLEAAQVESEASEAAAAENGIPDPDATPAGEEE